MFALLQNSCVSPTPSMLVTIKTSYLDHAPTHAPCQHISHSEFTLQIYFWIRRGDKEKEWGGVSLDLLPSYATACNSLQKEPEDVTGYFLASNEKHTTLSLPVVSFRRGGPRAWSAEFHSGSTHGLPASLNSETRDGSWQTLWSTSVSIRSSQPKKTHKKPKPVLDVSCLVQGCQEDVRSPFRNLQLKGYL